MVKKLIDKLRLSIKKLSIPESLEVLLLGNRITALTNAYLFGNALDILLYHKFPDHQEVYWSLGLTTLGLFSLIQHGGNTLYAYMRTKEQIKRNGKPTKEFLRKVMKIKDGARFDDHCNIQGAYLACRNYGCLDEFREVRRESNNLIPNF